MSPLEVIEFHLISAAAKISVEPNPAGLPGTEALQKLLNGCAALALLACVGAFIWGAAQWGFGNRSHNYSHSADGKSRMLFGLGGAFAIGAAAAVVNFFFNAGSAVR